MLVFRYASPGVWSVDLGQAAVRLGSLGLTANAELGSVGISTVSIDNPDLTVGHAADNIVAWKQFQVDELASGAGDRRIFTGLIGDRTYHRGRGPTNSLRTGPSGVIDMTVSDLNSLLTLRMITGTDGIRPVETVSARLSWLLGSAYLTTLVYDNGFIAANTTALDRVDFRGQRPHDVLGDLATITHYNFFVYYNEANSQPSLWFDEANLATTYDSGMTISNVLADINQAAIVAGTATTFYVLDDAFLQRSSAAVYSGAYITHAKGAVYVTNGTTATNFIARDGSAPNANLKTDAAATTTANIFLTDSATEDDRVTCTIQVAAAQANAIKAGQLVLVKFSDLPGYTATKTMRVMKRSTIADEPQRDRYKLKLEMTPVATFVCSFSGWSNPDLNSSLDLWGAYIQAQGVYVVSATLPPYTLTDAGTYGGAYGIPDNGSTWGVSSGVPVGDKTIDLRWVFDTQKLGVVPTVCTYILTGPGAGGYVTYGWSDDGTTFTSLGSPSLANAPNSIANLRHRYWWVRVFHTVLDATYYPGNDFDRFMIWAATAT